ncbi:hypothetical protein [Helicobacter cinaedi]|uniref:hypothetical protein n=1 Tax=Helicobacter cinaedi TaxID=213 RepID=UPI0015F25CCE|nr:hypothetical protein [Helicobacter cinaedi]
MIALNTIGSARGLLAGDFFDRDGNIKDNREGRLYTQGLENQARISANQTAGVGKLGEFTREQMNAIQYGAEAGALGQIAQGKALMDVHNRGQAFQDSYSKTAYMNAHQSLSQQKGAAQAYDSETNGGNIKIAESMGRVSNAIALRGHSLSVSAHGSESNMIGANAGAAMEKAFEQSAEHSAKVSVGVRDAKGRMDMGSDYALGKHLQTLAQTGKEIGDANNFASGAKVAAEELTKQAEMVAGEKAETSTLKKTSDNVGNITDVLLAANPSLGVANLVNKHLLGGESIGDKMQANFNKTDFKKGVDDRFKNEVAQDEGVKRAKGIEQAIAEGDFVSMGAQSTSQRFSMSAGNVFGDMNVNSSGGKQGSFQSGVSFSHNESRNYSFGTNVSGGSAIAGAALSMGMSASTYGAISSGVAAAGQVAGAAAMFLPGGAMGKGLANMGLIGGDSMMAAGVGAARATASKSATSLLDSVGRAGAAPTPSAGVINAPYVGGYNFTPKMAMQYNAMSNQGKEIFRRELGNMSPNRLTQFERFLKGEAQTPLGGAGGGVTGGVTNFPS